MAATEESRRLWSPAKAGVQAEACPTKQSGPLIVKERAEGAPTGFGALDDSRGSDPRSPLS
jgi:hypothetical protein